MLMEYAIFILLIALLVLPPLLWRRAGYHTQADAMRERAKRLASRAKQDEARRLLGIRENASANEVKRAHLHLMKKYHPDRGGSKDAAARINAAKDVLLQDAA